MCQMFIIALQWSGALFLGAAVYFLKEYYANPGCQSDFLGVRCLTLEDLAISQAILLPVGSLFYFAGILWQLLYTRDFFYDYILHLIVLDSRERYETYVDTYIKKSKPLLVQKYRSKLRPGEITRVPHSPSIWKDETVIQESPGKWTFYKLDSDIHITCKRSALAHYEEHIKPLERVTEYSSTYYDDEGYNYRLEPAIKQVQVISLHRTLLSERYCLRLLLYTFLCLLALAPVYKSVCKQGTSVVDFQIRKAIQSF